MTRKTDAEWAKIILICGQLSHALVIAEAIRKEERERVAVEMDKRYLLESSLIIRAMEDERCVVREIPLAYFLNTFLLEKRVIPHAETVKPSSAPTAVRCWRR